MIGSWLGAWTADIVAIGLTLAATVALFSAGEFMSARGVRREVTRKSSHILGGLWCVLFPWIMNHLVTVAVAAVMVSAIVEIARRRGGLKGLHGVGRSSWGPTVLPFGVLGAAVLTWHEPALYVASVLILTLGDAGAALVGKSFGRWRYSVDGHERSVEGSSVLFGVAALVTTLALGLGGVTGWGEAVIVGLLLGAVVAALEGISPMGLDNLAIPIGAALFLRHVATGPDFAVMVLAAVLTTGIVAFSLWRQHVTVTGALVTWLFGFSVAIAGGISWFVAAVLVFASINVASRFRAADKRFDAKGSTRDHKQILANVGLAIPAALAFGATGHPAAIGAFVGALAFAGADTLASELGVLSYWPPRAITTGRLVPAGTSGGVTAVGYGAASLGAVLPIVGLSVATATFAPVWVGVGLLAGLAGCTADSLLGDTVQGRFRCSVCGARTELPAHCAVPAARTAGLAWVDNDMVNLIGSAVSAASGAMLVWIALGLGWM